MGDVFGRQLLSIPRCCTVGEGNCIENNRQKDQERMPENMGNFRNTKRSNI